MNYRLDSEFDRKLSDFCVAFNNIINLPIVLTDRDGRILIADNENAPRQSSFMVRSDLFSESSLEMKGNSFFYPKLISIGSGSRFLMKGLFHRLAYIGPIDETLSDNKDQIDLLKDIAETAFTNFFRKNSSPEEKKHTNETPKDYKSLSLDSLYYEFKIDRQMELESMFEKAMREKDIKKVEELYWEISIHAQNHYGKDLRRMKNNMIIAIGRFGREAVKKGTAPGIAFLKTQRNLQKLERLKTQDEIHQFFWKIIREQVAERENEIIGDYSFHVMKAIKHINRYIYAGINSAETAEAMGLTQGYLSRLFRNETGRTLNDYIHLLKINTAKAHIDDSYKSMEEIAEILGYKSQSYFNYIFKKTTGITPGAYRNRIQSS